MRLLYLLSLLLLSPPSSAANPAERYCGTSNYAENSTFQANLGRLLSSLSLSSTNSTFATLTKGSTPDTAYGLFLCRGDISRSECRNCVQASTDDVLQSCPYANQAILWYDTCQLRYSSSSFFSFFENSIVVSIPVGGADTSNKNARELMTNLSDQAAHNSPILFATGEISHGGEDQNATYGLTQCTRDLSRDMCSQCLQQMFFTVVTRTLFLGQFLK